jgi:uncharacterized metal-binding protein
VLAAAANIGNFAAAEAHLSRLIASAGNADKKTVIDGDPAVCATRIFQEKGLRVEHGITAAGGGNRRESPHSSGTY